MGSKLSTENEWFLDPQHDNSCGRSMNFRRDFCGAKPALGMRVRFAPILLHWALDPCCVQPSWAYNWESLSKHVISWVCRWQVINHTDKYHRGTFTNQTKPDFFFGKINPRIITIIIIYLPVSLLQIPLGNPRKKNAYLLYVCYSVFRLKIPLPITTTSPSWSA